MGKADVLCGREKAVGGMRVAVISCEKYSDAWHPFFELFRRFFYCSPEWSYWLLTDFVGNNTLPMPWTVFEHPGTWCETLKAFADQSDEPFLLMQEDFFLNAPVSDLNIRYALKQMEVKNAGAVRIYPCPGATSEYGDALYGLVDKRTPYRISCQATIWKPQFVSAIAARCNTPAEFELNGTQYSDLMPEPVLAWKRQVEPWPIQYICSAIGRGKWDPNAKALCDKYGIQADFSRREFQSA